MTKANLIALSFIVSVILLFFPIKSVKAATLTSSSNQTSILNTDTYNVNVSITTTNIKNGTIYYLRGEFYNPNNPNTNKYCGFTWNGNSWYNGPYSGTGYQNLLPITINSNSWTGELKAMFDAENVACTETDQYNFRIVRYVSSNSPTLDTQTPLTVNITIGTPSPSPSPISTPTPVPIDTPSPTPSQSPSPISSSSPTPTVTPIPISSPKHIVCKMTFINIKTIWFSLKIPQITCNLGI